VSARLESPTVGQRRWSEICWHLYQWGDAVEVLEPEALREMVEGHRRGDFYPVLP